MNANTSLPSLTRYTGARPEHGRYWNHRLSCLPCAAANHPVEWRKSDGFTLLELLVTVAIVAVIIALTLPAVQRAREAANRVKCHNSLKHYALACHSYEAAHGRLPSMGDPPRADGGKWAVDIAPYCDRMTTGRADHGLDCPSKFRRAPQQSYAAADYEQAGIFPRRDRGLHSSCITDGLSNTVMLAEKWYKDGNTLNGRTIFARTCAVPFGRDDQSPGSLTGFGSAHPGGMPVAFGDGSVRGMAYTVDPAVWKAAGTRAGGD